MLFSSTNLNGFGCQKKHAVQNDPTPGPGAFTPATKNAWAHKTCESWSFGVAKRSDSLPGNDVGPGEYDPKHDSNMGRSFKLRERNEPKLFETSSLGPGAYNLPDTKTKKGTKFNALR